MRAGAIRGASRRLWILKPTESVLISRKENADNPRSFDGVKMEPEAGVRLISPISVVFLHCFYFLLSKLDMIKEIRRFV